MKNNVSPHKFYLWAGLSFTCNVTEKIVPETFYPSLQEFIIPHNQLQIYFTEHLMGAKSHDNFGPCQTSGSHQLFLEKAPS